MNRNFLEYINSQDPGKLLTRATLSLRPIDSLSYQASLAYGTSRSGQRIPLFAGANLYVRVLTRIPIDRPDFQLPLNERLARISRAHPAQADLQDRLIGGKENFPRIIVVTHQAAKLQDLTAEAIGEIQKQGETPVLVLASPQFPVFSRKLAAKATLLRYSPDGGFTPLPLITDEVHLFGGHVRNCLFHTFIELLHNNLVVAEKKTLRVVLHTSLMFQIDLNYKNEVHVDRTHAVESLKYQLFISPNQPFVLISETENRLVFKSKRGAKTIEVQIVD
jgi:hypothetical protein